MAKRDRDAIFELVVPKNHSDSLSLSDSRQEFEIERSRGTPALDQDDSGFQGQIMAVEEGVRTNGVENKTQSEVQSGHEAKVDLGVREGAPSNGAIPVGTSFDNATYTASKSTDKQRLTNYSLTKRDLKLFLVFMVILNVLLTVVVIMVIALASVNYKKIAQLQQNSVSDDIFHQHTKDVNQSLGDMQVQILNMQESLTRLENRTEQLSQEVSTADSQLQLLQADVTDLQSRLTEISGKLGSGLNSSLMRLSVLEENQTNFDLALEALRENASLSTAGLRSEVTGLRDVITSPVDVFENCQSSSMNETRAIVMSSNDSEPVYTVSTNPVDVHDTVSK